MMQKSDYVMLSYELQLLKDSSIQQSSEPWKQVEEFNTLKCRHRRINAGYFKGVRLKSPKKRSAEEDGQL